MPNDLRERRCKFTRLLAQLIQYANSLPGHEVAVGVDGLKHMSNSLHYSGLANDLALYVDGIYQTDTVAYKALGEYWEALDPECRWGGRFKKADGNHFSITYQGRA